MQRKEDLYHPLNKRFFLPSLESHAIDMPYLQRIMKDPHKIFTIKRDQMKNVALPPFTKSYNVQELIDILDQGLI